MSSEQYPIVKSGVVWRETDDGVVVVDPVGGKVRVFNGVGSDIWKMLQEKLSVGEIEGRLSAEYAIPTTQVSSDVSKFLNELDTRGLVSWA